MKQKINCIMLVDDNPDDNFFHERVIKKSNIQARVITKNSAKSALQYITTKEIQEDAHPDLIFLDINMPGMNGWEFMEEYNKLDKDIQARVIIVMLTTSDNPDDRIKAQKWDFVADYKTKPLTKEMLEEIREKYFSSFVGAMGVFMSSIF